MIRKSLFVRVIFLLLLISCNDSVTNGDKNKTEQQLSVSYNDGMFLLSWSDSGNKTDDYAVYIREQDISDFSAPDTVCSVSTRTIFIRKNIEIGKTYFFTITQSEKNNIIASATFRQTSEQAGFNHFKIKTGNGKASFYKNGELFFVQGIGGSSRLDLASSYGANAFRTWDASLSSTAKELDEAKKNNVYLMMGIWLSHNYSDYLKDSYKEQQKNKIKSLLNAFKQHPNLMIWCLGNEINLEGADKKESWEFVNELAGIIKEEDPNHPVATVISYSSTALNNIVKYAPDIDLVGINAYGAIYGMKEMFNKSSYQGAYMVSEWGPNGHWENGTTSWGAPIEPNSEDKRIEYENRYTNFILNNDRCVGSFVFLWGQKEERTPTWFSMFVEKDVPGLPINGEACPTVETMEKVWKKSEPGERAPIVNGIKLNGKVVNQTESFRTGSSVQAHVDASDPRGYALTYHWEILKEATVLGVGGSAEPRPDRVGEVISGSSDEQQLTLPSVAGNYRLYVYVLNGRGMAGTSNIPFQVSK